MDIFGLTPIDAALSAWGLNCSQKLTEFFFNQTFLGVTAFVAGFVWSLWQSVREVNFKHFAVFVVISLTGTILFIPHKYQQSSVKSAVEVYGASKNTAQSINVTLTNGHTIPTILSFIGQMADMVSIGTISILDAALSNNAKFLGDPFGPQKLSLQIHQIVHAPLEDVHLRESLGDFIYAQYLPSLIMYQNKTPILYDLHSLSPEKFRYDNSQWDNLKLRLGTLTAAGPWARIKGTLSQMGIRQNNLDEAIFASIIRGQIQAGENNWPWSWAMSTQTFFPYIMGWANFCVYVSFPVLMLAIVIVRRMGLFLRYAEIFLWVKSFYLTSAISYYISLMIAHLQAQTSVQANWFWDYPHYAVVASVLLCLMPVLTLLGVHQSFQLINHRT